MSENTEVMVAGYDAWQAIQASAKADRTHWRAIGAALLIGKTECPDEATFQYWLRHHSYGNMRADFIEDAIWMAENRVGSQIFVGPGTPHPTLIRWNKGKEARSDKQLRSELTDA